MTKKLTRYVNVDGPEGSVWFGPNDEVPDWAAQAITNPKAWAEDPDEGAEKESTGGTGSTGRRRSASRSKSDD